MRNWIIVFCIVWLLPCFAQKGPKGRKEEAFYTIQKLRQEGALVFIVKSSSKPIEAYQKSGKTELAKQMQQRLIDRQTSVMVGLSKYFDFCPFYFLSTEKVEDFISGARAGIFLRGDFTVDSSKQMDEPFYLFMERGAVQAIDEQGNPSENFSVTDALVLKDADRVQLRSPFPFYLRMLSKEKTNPKKLYRLNESFHRFLQESK